jgi:hypothetical protein
MNRREITEIAEKFLTELQSTIPDTERVMAGYADEATVQVDEYGKKINAGWWPAPWKLGKPINTNANCYACISSSIKTPNPKTGLMRFWRGDASFGHGLALMVDDIGHGKGSKGGLDLDHFKKILPPTAIVETSPDNFQLWYFFKEPQESLLYFRALLIGFVSNVLEKGGDYTIKDASRYGRMPCGINNKRNKSGEYKYEDGKYQVHLIEADYSRRYNPDEIAQAFQFEIILPTRRQQEFNETDYKIDAIWLKMAIQITNELRMGEGAGGEVVQNQSGKYRIRCPWGYEHANGDPFGAYFRGPIPGAENEFVFGCGHDTCRKENHRTWSSFIDEVVIPYISDKLERINEAAAK